jgi:AraC family transcriptional regulator
MDSVAKALWFIESRFARGISLAEIAGAAGVSRFNLSRVFAAVTGGTVMGYLRGRRLTEAARLLSAGAPDILAVALEVGYGSHEAFSRAFRSLFGMTPKQLRARGHLDNLPLMEPLRMDNIAFVDLATPRLVDGPALVVAGIGGRFTFATNEGIPALWQRFGPYIGSVPGQVGWTTYGISRCGKDGAGGFDYLCGVEVAEAAESLPELTRLHLPAQRYVVFTHRGHISTIRSTVHTIWRKYLPESGLRIADAPDFERYDGRFDPKNGNGEVEIWVPVAD